MRKHAECILIRKDTGEEMRFWAIKEANAAIGRSQSYISTCFKRGNIIVDMDGNEYDVIISINGTVRQRPEIIPRPVKDENEIDPRFQLCCYCAKFAGGCSWSRSFVPVKGWEAVPTLIKNPIGFNKSHHTESFFIKKCPQFERG